MKKVIPDKLFNLAAFQKICPVKEYVSLANIDLELFIKRYKVILNIEDEPYPFYVEFTSALEYCGKENRFRLYKISFGTQNNEMIFAVGEDNAVWRIVISADSNNSASIEAFAGAITVILRSIGLNVQELQAVNQLIQDEADNVFHWCMETERFVVVDACVEGDICYIGFSAAVE